MASYVCFREFFTTPAAFQYRPDIKDNIIQCDQESIGHPQIFCQLNIMFHNQLTLFILSPNFIYAEAV